MFNLFGFRITVERVKRYSVEFSFDVAKDFDVLAECSTYRGALAAYEKFAHTESERWPDHVVYGRIVDRKKNRVIARGSCLDGEDTVRRKVKSFTRVS